VANPTSKIRRIPAVNALSKQLALTLFAVLISAAAFAQSNLPTMGEPADNALSPLEEQAIGRQMMRQIRGSLPLARDTQLNEYIDTLGQQLVQASGRQNSAFNFFIVEDDSINAFAIPGGYIGVNVGLIDAMKYEDQLAGVVAHEIAHVTQRHHARMFARSYPHWSGITRSGTSGTGRWLSCNPAIDHQFHSQ